MQEKLIFIIFRHDHITDTFPYGLEYDDLLH